MAALSRLRQQGGITLLPHELVRRIAEKLPWGLDVANFRLIGRLWRDTVPLVNFAPLLMLPFDAESADGAVTFFKPTDGETITMSLPALHGKVVCGSSHGWLALVDVSGTVTLLNPFTGATVDLPPADEYLARASSSGYLRSNSDSSGWLVRYDNPRPVRLGEVRDVFFHEIVISSPPDSGDCVAMALLPCSSAVVTFCRVGVDRAWRTLLVDMAPRLGSVVSLSSIVHCRGSRFLVVGQNCEASICDIPARATPRVTRVRSLALPDVNPRGYLQVNGELHLVGSLMRGTEVYKCDVFAAEPTWSRVTDVGDITLFLSNSFMTGLAGASVRGLTKNSIYFSEPVDGAQEDLDHELEICDIANDTSEVFTYHKKTGTSSAALCWIQPKPAPWTQKEEEKLVLEMVKDHK